MTLADEFKNPPVKNRIKPFWFWNGTMNEEEIGHQIKEMKDKGIGGAFICPRQGLQTPYLSEEWFRKVRLACDKANEQGIENWLYDEYPYPSGMSGGEVLLRHPEAEQQLLKHVVLTVRGGEVIVKELGWGEILYAKACRTDAAGKDDTIDLTSAVGILQPKEIYQQTGLTAYNHKRFFSYQPTHVLETTLPEGEWKITVFYQEAMGDFKYYGGFFDPCNQTAVQTFLATTHEKYREHLGDQFGKTIHGMFSDEVGLLGAIPWSKQLPQAFLEKKGYSLTEVLPAMTDADYPDAGQIRYDYMDVLHQLFVASYHKQVTDWCREHGLYYATEVPSMRMSTQRYSDVIGGDTAHEKLGRSLEWIYDKYLGDFRYNSRSAASLARQLDKQYAMIESFHSVGWSMTLQDAKWMIDRIGSDGINLFNFHAFYYTIDSITKHDAPPSQFIQNPYWKHYRKLADYTARMSVLNTHTTVVSEIAVLDPVATLWSLLGNPFHGFEYGGDDPAEGEKCREIVEAWKWVCKTILFEQFNYDNLDTEIMAQARIENGTIYLGRAAYRILVIPPVIRLEEDAVAKIKTFLDCGGNVIQLGDADLFAADSRIHYVKDRTCFLETLKQIYRPEITFQIAAADRKSFITSVRRGAAGETFVFISNQERMPAKGTLCFSETPFQGAWKWNLEDGGKIPVSVAKGSLTLAFAPYESHCIELVRDTVVTGPAKEPAEELPVLTVETNEPMKVRIEGGNILRFEYFDFSVDGESWQRTDVKTAIEQFAGTKSLSGKQIQYEGMFGTPRVLSPAYPLRLYYRTEFLAEVLPSQIRLLMDAGSIVGDYTILINGTLLEQKLWKKVFINDQHNIQQDVSAYIRPGLNSIEIQVLAEHDACGVRDPLYLSGDFGVREDEFRPVLVSMPERVQYTDHYIKGFPYYSGTFYYETVISVSPGMGQRPCMLEFDFGNSRFDCMEVLVNGRSLDVRAFTPYRWKVPEGVLAEGENRLELRVTNTLANMLDGTYFDYEKHEIVRI